MSTLEATSEATVSDRVTATDPTASLLRTPAVKGRKPIDSRWLDWVERIFVLVLYGWLVAKILINYSTQGGLANLLLLPSEGLVVVFLLLRRRTTEISRSPYEWVIAMAATCAPLLVVPGVGRALIPPAIAATVLMMGMLIQLHAKIILGRSFGCVPAHRGLKLAGPYRFVRHPMYAGYLVSHSAFLAMNPTLWNGFVYALCYASQVSRLLAEERLLNRDPGYQEYSVIVRYRLIPWLF
ncbi:MAG TPA: methyltransferase [Isosphaeraceae bacterium]|nr:methyltransferase [Isosphaeraceae bacterium]